jgi:hypothetical protein
LYQTDKLFVDWFELCSILQYFIKKEKKKASAKIKEPQKTKNRKIKKLEVFASFVSFIL